LFEYIAQSKWNVENETKQAIQERIEGCMKKMIIDSCKSVKSKIIPQKHTFELLGYDFILDENLNTVLIEVNTNPCLEESNTLLRKILPRMVDDMLNIVLDPIFTPNSSEKYKSKFKLTPDVFSLGK